MFSLACPFVVVVKRIVQRGRPRPAPDSGEGGSAGAGGAEAGRPGFDRKLLAGVGGGAQPPRLHGQRVGLPLPQAASVFARSGQHAPAVGERDACKVVLLASMSLYTVLLQCLGHERCAKYGTRRVLALC